MTNFFIKKNNFQAVLPYYIDFVVPGFEKSYPRGLFKCPSFKSQASEEWFLSFVQEISESMGKKFLPIYRMGDGEFQLCVGYHYRPQKDDEPWWHYVLGLIRAMTLFWIKKIFQLRFVAKTAPDRLSANYAANELGALQIILKKQIFFVASKGILSLAVTARKNHVHAQQYFGPIMAWFKDCHIDLSEKNYIPVYFIYAMLTGPSRRQIYIGRHILIITSYDNNKREAIDKNLKNEGVASVQFIPISSGRSMYDKIDLSQIKKPIDLVLIGGGIGAANILCQLEPLNTVAIDAGYIIECLADPERKKKRTFCWPDEGRGGDYRPI